MLSTPGRPRLSTALICTWQELLATKVLQRIDLPDEQLPTLGGRTPREAVRDADGREAVQAVLPQFERDMARQDPVLNAGIIDKLRAMLGIG